MSKKILFWITVIWVMIIWIHSAMPGEISGEESGFFTEFFQKLGWFENVEDIEHLVRKIAHFIEYGILGSLVLLNVNINFKPETVVLLVALLIGIFVPFIDETIQLFPEGRNSAVADIWIDFAGYLAGFGVSNSLYKLYVKKFYKQY